MIIIDTKKFIKREKESMFFRSCGVSQECGEFCDYSKSEDLVEFEEPSGERNWMEVTSLFYGYPVREGVYVGVLKDNIVRTCLVEKISSRVVRGYNYLYASLTPVGAQRKLDIDEDYPLNRQEHHLPMPSDAPNISDTNDGHAATPEADHTSCSSLSIVESVKRKSNFLFFGAKDGRINLSVYKEHIELVFEPYCRGYKTIARVYSHSGELIKQWKGISFSCSCDLLKKYCEQTNDETEMQASEISFKCENGELFPKGEDKRRSIYDLFPSLPRY